MMRSKFHWSYRLMAHRNNSWRIQVLLKKERSEAYIAFILLNHYKSFNFETSKPLEECTVIFIHSEMELTYKNRFRGSTRKVRWRRTGHFKATKFMLPGVGGPYPASKVHIDFSKKDSIDHLNRLFMSDRLPKVLEGWEKKTAAVRIWSFLLLLHFRTHELEFQRDLCCRMCIQ